MHPRRAFVLAGAAATLLAGLAVPATAAGAKPSVEELLTDLNSPKAVDLDRQGDVIVGQGAFGPPGDLLEYVAKGKGRDTTNVVGFVAATDVATTPDGGQWVLSAPNLFHVSAAGEETLVADIAAYQAVDVDPADLEDLPDESNPYGVATHPSGDALVVDAAGNDLLRISRDGSITTMARFAPEVTPTDHLPFPVGADEIPAEAVPTTVTVGPDGHVYVGQLNGFPFRPGNAKIWRLTPDATDASCTATSSSGACRVHLAGFTAIQDIDFAPDNGKLYVLELAVGGVLAFEGGFETGAFPPARLLEVKNSQRKELAAGQISQPGGVAAANHAVHVTDGTFSGGRLLRVRG